MSKAARSPDDDRCGFSAVPQGHFRRHGKGTWILRGFPETGTNPADNRKSVRERENVDAMSRIIYNFRDNRQEDILPKGIQAKPGGIFKFL